MTPQEQVLRECRTIAVVGAVDDLSRPAGYVPAYMKEHGYRIVPVNPAFAEVLGEKSYPDLASVPFPVDVVNLFKRSGEVAPFVDEAIRIGAKAVWMQQGIVDETAAAKARAAGLLVVMDRCMKTDHRNLAIEKTRP